MSKWKLSLTGSKKDQNKHHKCANLSYFPQTYYNEENKYLNTLLFCKFSHLEIMEGSEIVIVGACPL